MKRLLNTVVLIYLALCSYSQTTTAVATWESGDQTTKQFGIYGTKGVPDAANKPGSRQAAVSWTDKDGNFWLFGGDGSTNNRSGPYLSDLWKYDLQDKLWTWVSGNNTLEEWGVYSITASTPAYKPGGRQNAVSWTDKNGNFWLFGGNGYTSKNSVPQYHGWLNDLWNYNIISKKWTWVTSDGLDSLIERGGIYKNDGSYPYTDLRPGSREFATSWTDKDGNFWLFGGFGHGSDRFGHVIGSIDGLDTHVNTGYLNDLWKFTPGAGISTAGKWTWLKGNDTASFYNNPKDITGHYGTKGIANDANVPPMTAHTISWTDVQGNLWMFGGTVLGGYMNTLWKFTLEGGVDYSKWTWMGGNIQSQSPGVYGTKGIADAANMPGGRIFSHSWKDAEGNLWLMGGLGFGSSLVSGELNDLWCYNISSKKWTWVSGDDVANPVGIYGTKGIPEGANKPGGRFLGVTGRDLPGNLFLFGGQGRNNSNNDYGLLNDLWKYTPSTLCRAPQNFSTYNYTTSAASLSWVDIPESKYNLQWKLTTSTSWNSKVNITSPHTLSGLANGTVYDFRVQKLCPAGISDYSALVSFSTVCGPPDWLPAQSTITSTTAKLVWTANPSNNINAGGYTIQWKPAGSSTWNNITNISVPNYMLTGLLAGTSYVFQLANACTLSGSGFGTEYQFSTPCPTPVGVRAASVTDNSVTLTWAAVPGAISYTLQLQPASGSNTWTTIPAITSIPYTVNGLTGGTRYKIQMQTLCNIGFSGYRGTHTFTTVCSVPTGLKAVNITSGSANVTWTTVNGAETYTLQWKKSTDNKWKNKTSTNNASYNLTGLESSTSYDLQVLTECRNAKSSYSTVTSFTTTACNAPIGLTTQKLFYNSTQLIWKVVPGAKGYTLQWKPSNATTWTTVSNLDKAYYDLYPNNVYYDLYPLASGTAYDFRVSTNCNSNSSSYSDPITFTTPGVPCSAPEGLTTTCTYYLKADGGPFPHYGPLHNLSSWFNSSGQNPSDFGAGKIFILPVESGNNGYSDIDFIPYLLTGDWNVDGIIKTNDIGYPPYPPTVLFLNGFTLSVKDVQSLLSGSPESSLIVTGESSISFYSGPGGSGYNNALKKLVINTGTPTETVTLKSPVRIYEELKIQSGELKAAIPGMPADPSPVTLVSSSSKTARVAPVTGIINIPVTVERFIPARRAWRLLSAPVKGSQSINQAWQEGATTLSSRPNPNPGYGTHITGGSEANGFDKNPFGASASILKYQQSSNGWSKLSNTKSTNVNTEPYMLYVRGDRGITLGINAVPPTNTVLRSSGPLKTGDQIFNVNASGFTAIANPYASPINFVTLTRNHVQNNFYLWDPKLGGANGSGGYVLLSDNGSGGYNITPAAVSPESQYIQSGQGFFVQSTGVAGSITIKESDKIATAATNVFRSSTIAKGLRTTLQVMDKGGETSVIDETFTAYGAIFSDNIDAFDPVKLPNMNENLATVRNGQTLMIERRQPVTGSDTIFLKLWNTEQKQYILQFTPENLNLISVQSAVLLDNYLKTTTAISLSDVTTVNINIDGNVASASPQRFMVVLGAKNFITENTTTIKGTFKLSPNPITGTTLNIQFINQPQGTYTIELTNNAGQKVFKGQLQFAGGSNTMPLNLKSTIAGGVYQLHIINQASHIKTPIKVIVN